MVSEKRYDTYQGSAHATLDDISYQLICQLSALWRARNAQERRIKAALARITDLGLVAS